MMFKKNFNIAIRNILRFRLFSFINIVGLAIGVAGFILIMLWIKDELSFDRYHKNADRICRVIWNIDNFQIPAVPGPFSNWMEQNIPEVEHATRINHGGGIFQYKNTKIKVVQRYIEPSFFQVFSFRIIKGDSATALKNKESVIITEDLAHKLFGNEDPIGKNIFSVNGNSTHTVTAVIQNIPRLTQPYLIADCFLPMELMRYWRNPDDWFNPQDYKAYVLLRKGASAEQVTQKINVEFFKFLQRVDPETGNKARMTYYLQPIIKTHLYSHYKFDYDNGDIQYVIYFSIIAGFILLIAFLNYVNLTTASSLKRAHETGLKKVLGVTRWQLIYQFISESILITTLVYLLALVFVESLLQFFNNLCGKPLFIDYSSLYFIGFSIAFIFITGVLAGIYPAFFLSSFKISRIINRKNIDISNKSSLLRSGFVAVQFVLSVIIISGTLIVFKQLYYIKKKDTGFEKENVIYLKSEQYFNNYETLKNELLKNPKIAAVSASSELLTNIGTNNDAYWEGKSKDQEYFGFPTLDVSVDFPGTFKLKMKEGRFYSNQFPSDYNTAYVVNEAAVRAMKLQDPVGKIFQVNDKKGHIIGVVKDFNFKSLHNPMSPMILNLSKDFQYLYIRTADKADKKEIMSVVNRVYSKYNAGHIFETHFMQDAVDDYYHSEEKLEKLFVSFSFLAIFISCMGLLGLISYIIEDSRKKIGVQKVNGATNFQITAKLVNSFTKVIIVANIIGWITAYFIMDKWLQNFAYKTSLSWWIFAIAGFITISIAVITIFWQSWRAAAQNPIDALRYE